MKFSLARKCLPLPLQWKTDRQLAMRTLLPWNVTLRSRKAVQTVSCFLSAVKPSVASEGSVYLPDIYWL